MLTAQLNARLSLSTDTMHLENRTPQITPIPNEELLGLHARFSKSLAWMDTGKYMGMSRDDAIGKGQDYYLRLVFNVVYRKRIISLFVAVTAFPTFPTALGSITVVRSSVRLRWATLDWFLYIWSFAFDDRLQTTVWLVFAKRISSFGTGISC